MEACEKFYIEVMGMEVLHRANANLVYLTCGNDNLSLARAKADPMAPRPSIDTRATAPPTHFRAEPTRLQALRDPDHMGPDHLASVG